MNKIYYVYVKGIKYNKCYIKYTNSIKKFLKCFDNVISIYTSDYIKVY